MLDITKNIQSLTTFRRKSGAFLKQLKKSQRPVALTVNRKAETGPAVPGTCLTRSVGNMTNRVELRVRAAHDFSHLLEEIHARESAAAARWYNGLEKAVYTWNAFLVVAHIAPDSKQG